jgi:hypothetical protein
MLDKLLGELSFDPLAFARMEPKKQFDELRRVAKLEVDFDKLKGLNRSDYRTRTEINREAKAKRAQADGIVIPPEISGEVSDESALVDELAEGRRDERRIEKRARSVARPRRRRIEYKRGNANTHRKRAAELRAQADGARRRSAAMDCAKRTSSSSSSQTPNPCRRSTSDLRGKIDRTRSARTARSLTGPPRSNASRRSTHEAAEFEKQSREMTERIDAREKAKQEAIKRTRRCRSKASASAMARDCTTASRSTRRRAPSSCA